MLLLLFMLFISSNAFVVEYEYHSNYSDHLSYNLTEVFPRENLEENITITISQVPREGDVIVFKNGQWTLDSPPDLAYISTMGDLTKPYSYYNGNGRTVFFGYNTIMVTDTIYYNNHYFHVTMPGTYELQAAFPNMVTNYNINYRWYAIEETDRSEDIDTIKVAHKWWYLKPVGSAGSSTEQRSINRRSSALNMARATVAVEKEARFVLRAFGYGKVGYEPCKYLQKCNNFHGMSPWATIRQLSKKFYVDHEMNDVNEAFTDNLHKVYGVATQI